MMLCLRLNVLLLLIGSAVSLNHETNTKDKDSEVDLSGPWKNAQEFFDRIPNSFMGTPTESPTSSPTSAPTSEPTLAPAEPTPKPIQGPTPKPIPQGRFPTPQMTPTAPPTHVRTADTRTSFYSAEWGADTNGCSGEDALPNVFFHCHAGGLIDLIEYAGALCTKVGYDRIQCTQDGIENDASISFSCSGIRNSHLMATAEVGPNVVSQCEPGGNTVKFLTLGRQCDDYTRIDVNRHCNGGLPYDQGDAFYCVAPSVCSNEYQYSCDELKLHPLAMSNTNTDIQCSYPAAFQLTTAHEFQESYLTSYTLIDWRISGNQRGCLWKSPPLLIKCENGGHLEFAENYEFCKMLPGNIAECESFEPYSLKSEESVELKIQCAGVSESQLILSVESLSETVDAECGAGGTVIQSVMLSRKCGQYENHFSINHPSFCDSQDQVFTVDSDHSHCFVGNTCTYNYCDGIHIPALSADTGSGPYGFCTFVEY